MIHSLPTTTLHNHILLLLYMNVPVYDIQQLWDIVVTWFSVYDFMLQLPVPFNLNTSIHSDAKHGHLNTIRNKQKIVNSNKDYHSGILYHQTYISYQLGLQETVCCPLQGAISSHKKTTFIFTSP